MNSWELRVSVTIAAIAVELLACTRGEQDEKTTLRRIRALITPLVGKIPRR